MAISYQKLKDILEKRGLTSYILVRKYKVIGAATWAKIQHGGNIDMHTLNSLCKFLNCRVEDLIEYIPDEE